MDAQLDLELLEALLLRAEVVDIRVGEVVRLTEHRACVALDDLLRELVELLVAVAHETPHTGCGCRIDGC